MRMERRSFISKGVRFMGKPSKNWMKMAEIYRLFKPMNCECSYTEEDARAMYDYETNGIGDLEVGLFNGKPPFNGFVVGKKGMDLTVAMWREDIPRGLLYKSELTDLYPKWWLDKVIGDVMPPTVTREMYYAKSNS